MEKFTGSIRIINKSKNVCTIGGGAIKRIKPKVRKHQFLSSQHPDHCHRQRSFLVLSGDLTKVLWIYELPQNLTSSFLVIHLGPLASLQFSRHPTSILPRAAGRVPKFAIA